MKVSQCMSRNVSVSSPDQTLQSAARTMSEIDAGFLPVGIGDRLVGIVTDRDIVLRGVGAGKPPEAPVSDVMSDDVLYCFDDDDTRQVTENMARIQVRRLPVVDRNKRLVGIISLSDLSREAGEAAGAALRIITQPSAQHSQSV